MFPCSLSLPNYQAYAAITLHKSKTWVLFIVVHQMTEKQRGPARGSEGNTQLCYTSSILVKHKMRHLDHKVSKQHSVCLGIFGFSWEQQNCFTLTEYGWYLHLGIWIWLKRLILHWPKSTFVQEKNLHLWLMCLRFPGWVSFLQWKGDKKTALEFFW